MKTTIIKIGGNALKKSSRALAANVRSLLKKSRVVVVHGGGPEVSQWLLKTGSKPRFADGVRYTDAVALEMALMVLAGKINKEAVALLGAAGIDAAGISAADGATAVCRRVKKLGFVGEPVKINTALIRAISDAGFVPVISSIGADARGRLLNVNADVLADAVARALKSSRLIYVTDVPGVLDASRKVIAKITPASADTLIKKGVIASGMIPKVKSAFASVKKGVGAVIITDLKSKGTELRAK